MEPDVFEDGSLLGCKSARYVGGSVKIRLSSKET